MAFLRKGAGKVGSGVSSGVSSEEEEAKIVKILLKNILNVVPNQGNIWKIILSLDVSHLKVEAKAPLKEEEKNADMLIWDQETLWIPTLWKETLGVSFKCDGNSSEWEVFVMLLCPEVRQLTLNSLTSSNI